MHRIIVFLLSLTMVVSAFAHTKAEADNLYKQQKYAEAAQAYEALLRSGEGVSAPLYYNLGNAYYKLDDIPHAILNYERALLIEPGDGDIRANLALARGKTTDKVTPPSEMFFITWWHNICNSMSNHAWSIFAIVCFVIMLCGVLVYMFLPQLLVRKVGAYGAMLMFALVIVSNFAAYTENEAYANRNTAIVMSPAVSVKSSPNEASTDLFVIHEGSKVEILDASMKQWYEVKFEEGKQGWIPVSSIEVI